MDAIDQKIIEELQRNGRAPASAVSQKVNLSVPAVLERIRKLTNSGVILGYAARVDRRKLGRGLLAFVFVRLEGCSGIEPFREQMAQFPQVLECHHIAGPYDYLLKVAVEHTDALEHFLTVQLKTFSGVAETNTQIVLATLKEASNG
ncbi:MAG TPA: Lrp/AsnC family transcriptional regulator [Candidatus Limiplasma sp.]|nr:Lrp/AsnC family transcriptional regulator [Candidatus Limiplasma sp.]HPS81560.1 Lrp/AsnC family transcriptional regulator [Candidatus Limiplasma sp.]